jgi:hypothetical protein
MVSKSYLWFNTWYPITPFKWDIIEWVIIELINMTIGLVPKENGGGAIHEHSSSTFVD